MKKLKHPWWHWFFTDYEYIQGFRPWDKSYHMYVCSKCKKKTFIEDKDETREYEEIL